jgi:hypothetical protein
MVGTVMQPQQALLAGRSRNILIFHNEALVKDEMYQAGRRQSHSVKYEAKVTSMVSTKFRRKMVKAYTKNWQSSTTDGWCLQP